MTLLRVAMSWFVPTVRYGLEIDDWRRTGQYPDEIVRAYRHDRGKERDMARMFAAGYEVERQDPRSGHATVVGGVVLGQGKYNTEGGWWVTYRRRAFGNTSRSATLPDQP